MSTIRSRLTSQGQISVPAEIRRKLGVGPGSVLEWEEKGGQIVVRRAGRYSSAEIHAAVFGAAAARRGAAPDVNEGIRKYIRRRHARD